MTDEARFIVNTDDEHGSLTVARFAYAHHAINFAWELLESFAKVEVIDQREASVIWERKNPTVAAV